MKFTINRVTALVYTEKSERGILELKHADNHESSPDVKRQTETACPGTKRVGRKPKYLQDPLSKLKKRSCMALRTNAGEITKGIRISHYAA